MRDINRIDAILAEIREAWVKEPDLRLGQLLECARECARHRSAIKASMFYIEDDLLIEGVRKFFGGRV